MLSVNQVSMHFGGLVALDGVNMTVKDGEIRGLIGPNGSGKTTLINVITGFYAPTKGTVEMDGQVISGRTPNAVAKAGLCRTFQNINLFSEMSALENVVTAACTHQTVNLGSAIFQTKALKAQEKECHDKARELLSFVGLGGKEDVKATNLPYGQQRLLEIARALATEPKLLLLDEPVAGMNEQESDEAAKLVHKLRESGKTILLIEHHMKFVMSLCDSLTVLNYGKVIAEGIPSEIQNNEDVISIYLGKKRGK
ncbi:MAG: ABC transporter ATP-binding protein [Lachnospiraceae bacterium]|nr:ABC transporter ATP-binding protein [Lachnospiraceae bacterium]MCI9486002.1 ABC transporter ATP-binding protein [Lachnospiraceae bacterium]